MAEHGTPNPRVRGSIPRGPTLSELRICRFSSIKTTASVNGAVNGYAAKMAGTSGKSRRSRGHIRRRGRSFQVLVYAGIDPLTGKDHYLTEPTTSEAQAQKILTRLLGTVDEQRNPRDDDEVRRRAGGVAADARGRGNDARRVPRLPAAHDRAGVGQGRAREDHASGTRGVLRRPAPVPAPLP